LQKESEIFNETAVKVHSVSKKYCKSIKRSMYYGIVDILRNGLGLQSKSGILRSQEFWAVENISFEVKRGEAIGIIGPNGAGKTTLLKMLNGIFWPDKGKITLRGKVGGLIEVGAGFHPLLTGRENIYVNAAILGLSKKQTKNRFDSIVEFADIGDFLDTPVKHYSSGMFVRLGFSVAVHCEPDILLIDEILAVGDEGFQQKCFNKMGELRKNGTTMLLVSHNMHAISTFAQKVILVYMGQARLFCDVAEGVNEYSKIFVAKNEMFFEKISSGNQFISFFDVDINKTEMAPNESFSMILHYNSIREFKDVEIDIAILNNMEQGLYFQATNRAYNKKIDLKQGMHLLKVRIEGIKIQNSYAKIAIAIWSTNRHQLLFWWRIPVQFSRVDHSTGYNFLKVDYALD
jgi:lipopolysaccharide transport system ATP-binding protein